MKNSDFLRNTADSIKDNLFLSSDITIHGRHTVIIDGCKKIEECSDILVKICTSDSSVEIWGTDLEACSFGNDCFEIRGNISSVALGQKRKDGDRNDG